MKYIKLADNTIIAGCSDSTTAYEIEIVRDTYEAAGIEADKINDFNISAISVYNELDELTTKGINLILSSISINECDDYAIAHIRTRNKTQTETMQEEIAELQEAVIEGA